MPYIAISLSARPDPALSARIADRITELTRDILRKDPKVTAVCLTYVDPDHWFAGGKSLTEQGLASFWLDIKVVDGTNTKQETTDYIAAVFAEFVALLGPLHSESYVLVHEVPAAAYGFGGLTQEYRFISGRIAQGS